MIANPLGRLTEDSHLTHCKFVGTPSGRQPPHALQIRRDASRKKGRFKINIRPPADFHLHNSWWTSAYQLLCKRTTAVVRLER